MCIYMTLYELKDHMYTCICIYKYLGSSQCAELIGFLHNVGFSFGKCRVSAKFVLDVLHGYLDSSSGLLAGSWLGFLMRFVLIRAVILTALGVFRDLHAV